MRNLFHHLGFKHDKEVQMTWVFYWKILLKSILSGHKNVFISPFLIHSETQILRRICHTSAWSTLTYLIQQTLCFLIQSSFYTLKEHKAKGCYYLAENGCHCPKRSNMFDCALSKGILQMPSLLTLAQYHLPRTKESMPPWCYQLLQTSRRRNSAPPHRRLLGNLCLELTQMCFLLLLASSM